MGRLNEEALHVIWDSATNTPEHAINPKLLINMVEEIRSRRKTMVNGVGTRLLKLDEEARHDLVGLIGLAINAPDAEEFSECLITIAEMIFPELMGEIIFRRKCV